MARRLVAAVLLVMLVAGSRAQAETDLFVGGVYCGRLAQLVWKKRQVHALDCTSTTVPAVGRSEETEPKLFVGSVMVGYVCDLAPEGRDLSGMQCDLRFARPGSERLPTPTPTQRTHR